MHIPLACDTVVINGICTMQFMTGQNVVYAFVGLSHESQSDNVQRTVMYQINDKEQNTMKW